MAENHGIESLVRQLEVDLSAGSATALWAGWTSDWRVFPYSLVMQASAEGRASVEVGMPGAEVTVPIRKSQAVLIPSGLRHRVDAHEDGYVSRWANLRISMFGVIDLFAAREQEDPRSRILFIAQPWAGRIGKLCSEIGLHPARALSEEGEPSKMMAEHARRKGIGYAIAAEILSSTDRAKSLEEDLPRLTRLGPLLTYIDEHLGETITRSAMAKRAHVSVTGLHNLFKSAVGQSPKAYLLNRRLQRAQQLLMSSDEPVATIGLAVGFADPFHFSRSFKTATGVSPRAYRGQIRLSLGRM
jgi:AraC-like DNA-binding protein